MPPASAPPAPDVARGAEPAAGRHTATGRLLLVFGSLLGGLLAGYLFFDRAFAYLHVPGTPLYVGELVIAVGVAAVLLATGHLIQPLRHEPVLLLLCAFLVWGLARTLTGLREYGMDAVRDAALVYYGLCALVVVALLARSPAALERWLHLLEQVSPWLLVWLVAAVLLFPVASAAPTVPFTDVSVLSHKPGNVAIAALLVLASTWLLAQERDRARLLLTLLAVLVVAIAGTQNRGGLVAAMVGITVLLVLHPASRRSVGPVLGGLALLLSASVLLPVGLSPVGLHGRDVSAQQLTENVRSLVTDDSPGNLEATVDARKELWSRIVDKQSRDGLLLQGAGFGPNLAADVSVYDDGEPTLRNPHNSQLHVLARTGLVGAGLWVALWLGWFWRLVSSLRRLQADGLHRRCRVAVLCLVVVPAILVASLFDPVLEGPQVALLLWTLFGVGIAVTSPYAWFVDDAGRGPGPAGTTRARSPEGTTSTGLP